MTDQAYFWAVTTKRKQQMAKTPFLSGSKNLIKASSIAGASFPADEHDVYHAATHDMPAENHGYSTRPPPDKRRRILVPTDKYNDQPDATKRGLELGAKLGYTNLHRMFRTARYWVFEFSGGGEG
jgi:hypothetical protein